MGNCCASTASGIESELNGGKTTLDKNFRNATEEEQHAAATKIQASYRGVKTRKEVRE